MISTIRDTTDQRVAINTQVYVERRLQDPSVLRWAAALGPQHYAERFGVMRVLQYPRGEIAEPFRSAWQCVVESWSEPEVDYQFRAIEIDQAIKRGVNPILLVDDLARLVSPRLTLERPGRPTVGAKRHKSILDLIYVDLKGPEVLSLKEVGFESINDAVTLGQLVDRLEASIVRGLHWTTRLGPGASWRANWVSCVYYRTRAGEDGAPGERDVDQYREGFATAAKLYSAFLQRLVSADVTAARSRHARLRQLSWPLTRRLWATAARDAALASGQAVGAWLLELDDDSFWRTSEYPEIAELRAARFSEISPGDQKELERRLRRRPPANIYRRTLERGRKDQARTRAAIREITRIEAAGAILSDATRNWLDDRARADRDAGGVSDTLEALYGIGAEVLRGFGEGAEYQTVDDAALIERLEIDLQGRLYLESRTAFEYVEQNWDAVLRLLRAQEKPAVFARVWAALASANDPPQSGPKSDDLVRAQKVLDGLLDLSPPTLEKAADGAVDWLSKWSTHFRGDSRFAALWLAVWPSAAPLTNASRIAADEEGEAGAKRANDLATSALNSKVGYMMTAFLNLLPDLREVPKPFNDQVLASMRAAVISADGEAKLHALHRLIMHLGYMRRADEAWTQRHLFPALTGAQSEAMELWDAISRIGVPDHGTMKLIGPSMAKAARDAPIAAEVRAHLGERVVFAVLRDIDAGTASSIDLIEVQQMLRVGGDLLRAECADVLPTFVEQSDDPAKRYRKSVRLFIREVWPKDRSNLSAGAARSFARLPAACGDAFVECVEDIEALLVPFDAWSLFEYRLYVGIEGDRELRFPKTPEEAEAALTLLDRTIGDAEGAVVPHDLDRALDAIRTLAPALTKEHRYARLATLARR